MAIRGKALFFAAAIAVITLPGFAQTRDPVRYERWLLPFQASMAGGSGTWRVSWWVRNDSPWPMDAFPLASACGLPPPPTPAGPAYAIAAIPAVPPHRTLSCFASDALPSFLVPYFVPIRGSVGAFLYVQRADNQPTVLGSVAWDSAAGREAPAQLRPVRSSSFLAGTHSIMPIEAPPDSRIAIRVYALADSVDSPAVTARLFDMQPWTAFAAEERLIEAWTGELASQPATLFPCLGTCDVPPVALAPMIYQAFAPGPAEDRFPHALRVEIEPESANVRWWALVSVTDNETNAVRLYEPQRRRLPFSEVVVQPACDQPADLLGLDSRAYPDAVFDDYFVAFQEGTDGPAEAARLSEKYGFAITGGDLWMIPGFTAKLDPMTVAALRCEEFVLSVSYSNTNIPPP